MSKRPASSASGRKEFFGLAAQLDSSALNPASDGLANSQEVLRRSGRNSAATPTAATAPASPAKPARNLSEPSQVVRSRSASRVRAPAVLPTEGPTRALKASAPAPIIGADAENLEPPLPTKAKEKKKARARSDPVSPLGVEDRVRIPVHLAADCEWTDAQVLAADELRRAAANSAHFFSTGSASTGVPSTIGAVQPPAVVEEAAKILEPSGKKAKKSKSSKKITADSQPADVVPTSAAVAPLPVIGAPSPAVVPLLPLNGSVAPKPSRSQKSSSRFPVTFLLNHDQEKQKSLPFGKAKPAVQLIKVKQSAFDALHENDRIHFEVYTSESSGESSGDEKNPVYISSAEDSEEDQPDGTSGRGPPAKKAALNLSQSGPSAWSRPDAHQRPNVIKPAQDPAPAAESSHKVLLLVKKSAIDGSCLFDSIAQGLAHILEHDISAFGGNSSRSAQEAIRALTDPMLLRQMICDHLCGPFADVQLACLSDQSPRQSAIMDYVEHGYPLLDADWKPPASNPKQVSQTITSYADYVAAMRRKGASGDEICLAASADLLGLRHIVFDTRGYISEGVVQERLIDLSLDLLPENLNFELRANRQERRLSSRMPLILLRDGAHFDRMNCVSDDWNKPEDDTLEHLEAITTRMIPEVYNPGGFASMHPPNGIPRHRRASTDQLMRPLPCEAILKKGSQIRAQREVLTHMVDELGIAQTEAEQAISLLERDTGGCIGNRRQFASMHNLPLLTQIAKTLSSDYDMLTVEQHQASAMALNAGNTQRCGGCHSAHHGISPCRTSEQRARSKFHSAAHVSAPASGPRPDYVPTARLGTFRERMQAAPSQPLPISEITEFDNAVTALMVTTNIPRDQSASILSRHLIKGTSPLAEPLRRAFKEVEALKLETAAKGKASHSLRQQAPVKSTADAVCHELEQSRADFISKHLSGARAMSAQEIRQTSKNQRTEEYTGVPADLIPRNLERYWRHHQGQILLTPRGAQPSAEYQRRIHVLSTEALHQEACEVARKEAYIKSEIAKAERAKLEELKRAVDTPAPAYDPRSPAYEATREHRSSEQDMSTPASAAHAPAPASAMAILSHIPPSVTMLPPNSSPAVRLAQARELRSAAAASNPSAPIKLIVDTGVLPANSVIWRQGAEADGAGFNYHAFSGVKASWEQANTDKDKSYHTFKSFIDARFISTICDYIGVERTLYDSTSDTVLLQKIEARLKPTDSTVYFVKLNGLRLSTALKDGSLSVRYQLFADKFLATVNEAREAGTPLLEDTIKTAFKSVCNSIPLLKMWAGAEKWTTLQAVHQRLFDQLQRFEAHALCKSLSETAATPEASQTPAQPPAPAPPPLPPAAPAAHPRQHYTQEQRRDYALQKQVTATALAQQNQLTQQNQFQQQQFAQLQQQQQHQQQIMVNAMQHSVESALQRLGNSLQQPLSNVQLAAPATQAQPQTIMQFTAPITSPPVLANYAQPAAAVTPHPGLDARGPHWHNHSHMLLCRNTPCGSTMFCQGCGMHGHSSAECRRRMHSGWNATGYYCDRYPGMGPLPYETSLGQPANQRQAQTPPVQQQLAPAQPKIAPPPFQQQRAGGGFPTPHRMNYVQRGASQATSPVTANVSTQAVDGAAGGA